MNALESGAAASESPTLGQRAEAILLELFTRAGWRVHLHENTGTTEHDLIFRRGSTSYVVEVKSASEGRSDRLIPLWSQAYLQALRAASGDPHPVLVVVAAPKVSPRVADQVLRFAAEHAPDAAAAVIDHDGLRRFRGKLLEDLNTETPPRPDPRRAPRPGSDRHTNIFSDLNQWMLKVLLAPELPETMLSAPRNHYRNASQLAAAAGVSVMSASRLVRQLQHDGYLHESKPHLELVRRGELLRTWQNSAARRAREVPLRFLLRGEPKDALIRVTRGGDACLALFAAADALGFGFVKGVPPYLYVRRITPGTLSAWKNVIPARLGESPDLVVREAAAPSSVFRGAVERDGVRVCDILQVWLDVATHPTRGKEQADLIRRKILGPLIEGEDNG